MRILITGASGFIGRHLLAGLRAGHNDVVVFSRGTSAAAGPGSFAGPADLADIEAWEDWPRDIDCLVHLAALNPERGARQASDIAALRRANVDATAALTRRAVREGVRRMVLLSTANVHSPAGAAKIFVDDPPDPQSPYALSKMEAEHAFWNGLSDSGTEGCVLRPAPVYGAGGRGNVARLIKLAKLPLPLPLRGLGGPRSLVAVDHLVDVIGLCLAASGVAGETFLVADEGPLDPAGIVSAVRQGWGRPSRVLAAPVAPLQWLAGAAGKGGAWRGATQSFILDMRHTQDRLKWRSPQDTAAKLRDLARSGVL